MLEEVIEQTATVAATGHIDAPILGPLTILSAEVEPAELPESATPISADGGLWLDITHLGYPGQANDHDCVRLLNLPGAFKKPLKTDTNFDNHRMIRARITALHADLEVLDHLIEMVKNGDFGAATVMEAEQNIVALCQGLRAIPRDNKIDHQLLSATAAAMNRFHHNKIEMLVSRTEELPSLSQETKELVAQALQVSAAVAPEKTGKKAKLFISYSHDDEALKDQLMKQLSVLDRGGRAELWHDRMIRAGAPLDDTIDEQLERADLFLFLVSPSFISSDYCYSKEYTRAMQRRELRKAELVSLILKECAWEKLPLGKSVVLPKDGRPVTFSEDGPARDQVLADVARELWALIEESDILASGR